MKKIEIISTYNSLLPTLYELADHYEAATGKKYQEMNMRNYRSLGERALTWGKDALERHLYEVQRYITDIPKDEEIFIANRDFKESDQGTMFIANLESKQHALIERIKGVTKTFYESFNSLLNSVGLAGWEIPNRIPKEDTFPYVMPTFRRTFFDIQMKDMKNATLHVTIERNKGEWKMEVSSSMHCRVGGIQVKDEQYHQYKAYVTIHDFSLVFQTWMENNYAAMAKTIDELIEEVNKVDEQLRDPWTAWKESTM